MTITDYFASVRQPMHSLGDVQFEAYRITNMPEREPLHLSAQRLIK